MQVRDGPAAVFGDKIRLDATFLINRVSDYSGGEGAEIKDDPRVRRPA